MTNPFYTKGNEGISKSDGGLYYLSLIVPTSCKIIPLQLNNIYDPIKLVIFSKQRK